METEKTFRNIVRIGLGILLLRCFYLQVIRYPYYADLSRRNCIRTVDLGTPRGEIWDRNGRVLAQDVPCFNAVFVPYDLKDGSRVVGLLSDILGMDREKLLKTLSRSYGNPFDRIPIKNGLTQEEMTRIEENAYLLPGIYTQSGINRRYSLGDQTCHLLGYTGEISQTQLDRMQDQGFKAGDVIGQAGLEKMYDGYLRGVPGGIQVEVDARGHQRRILGKKVMKPGNAMVLTVDQTIQEICAGALGDRAGCVVALNPSNGQILALVSRPGFDPLRVADFLNRPDHPFLNRVIQGQYPPGSIFKIVTETAALETGAVQEYDRVECTGSMEVGDIVFHCWSEEGHGWVDIDKALPMSCNIFFGTLGMKMGVRTLLEYGRRFGLGQPTGIDLPGEKGGNIPSPEDSGGPLNLAIGQGALLTTPLQLAVMTAAVANGGNIWKPYIVQRIVSPSGETIREFAPALRSTVYISPETLDILKRGLRNVVAYGTGAVANAPNVEVAGKTGTAQRGHRDLELATLGGFACYAPAGNPNIVVVVFLDRAGSRTAAAIAGRILEQVFALAAEKDEHAAADTREVQDED